MPDTPFFLGRWSADSAPVHYDPADLTTHAVAIGMTGSGKTGLLIGLLEEAALQGIPAIVIDPKGDLTNLLLHFPNLSAAEFAPWVDPEQARRQGMPLEQLAEQTAAAWRTGLEGWGLGAEQVAALAGSVVYDVFTPGSTAGTPVNLLSSFAAPADWDANREALRERAASTVTALLGLIGLSEIDPLRSREHILLANILEHAWSRGVSLDLPGLIEQVTAPPFSQLGAFPLERFFPEKDRFELALLLNNFLAAPSFQTWLEGQPLDAGALFYTPDGRPRCSVFYLAHLSETERMFFVTLLLAAVEAWMRGQRGTSSLRALLAFDEIVGYLPPTANPPSRPVLLRMLKQARAFGLGMLLSTQNPTDLNYKALSNAGTWFIGRLQTERDKERLLDGLQALEAGVDRAAFERIIAGLGKRQFLLHNVHTGKPGVFNTRWALNYLAGPLTRAQIPELRRQGLAAPLDRSAARPAAGGGAPGSPGYGATPGQPAPGSSSIPGSSSAAGSSTAAHWETAGRAPGEGMRDYAADTGSAASAQVIPARPQPSAPGAGGSAAPGGSTGPGRTPAQGGSSAQGSSTAQGSYSASYSPASYPAPAAPPARTGKPSAPGGLAAAGPAYSTTLAEPPALPGSVAQFFFPASVSLNRALAADGGAHAGPLEPRGMIYRPALLAQAEVRYLLRKYNLDGSRRAACLVPAAGGGTDTRPEDARPNWDAFAHPPYDSTLLGDTPAAGVRFRPLPAAWSTARGVSALQRDFAEWVYRGAAISLRANEELKVYAGPDLPEREFRRMIDEAVQAGMQPELAKQAASYDRDLEALSRKIERQRIKVQRQEDEVGQRQSEQTTTDLEFVAGLFTRRRKSISRNITKRRMTAQARGELQAAKKLLEQLEDEYKDLQREREDALRRVHYEWQQRAARVIPVVVTPLKKDIYVELFGLAWLPYHVVQGPAGLIELPGF